MNLSNFKPDWNKPSIFSAQTYGTKTTVEIDHSDLSLDEVMNAFETLVTGMGYHKDSWKEWILDRAAEYQEEENEKWDEDEPYTYEQFKKDEEFVNLRHSTDREYTEEDERRMDIIGQNGNEGTHYFEDVDGGFQAPPPNGVLIDAKKQYDEQMKKKDNPKQFNGIESKEPFVKTRKKKKKTVQDWEDEFELGGHE